MLVARCLRGCRSGSDDLTRPTIVEEPTRVPDSFSTLDQAARPLPAASPPISWTTHLLAVAGLVGLGWLLLCAVAGLAESRLDDAYITYNYSRSLAEGHGIRFNATDAEPIEGSSSLLHVGVVAAAMRVGLEPLATTRVISVVAFLALPLLLAGLVVRFTRTPWAIALISALAPCGMYAVLPETAGHLAAGMETLIFVALHAAAIVWALSFAASDRRPGGAAMAAGAVLLVVLITARPEGLVLSAAYLLLVPLFRLALPGRAFRDVGRAWAAVAALVAAGAGAFLAWKLWYFGHLVPTAYYVKANNALFGSSGAWLPGLPTVAQFLVLRLLPAALGIACVAALLAVPGWVRRAAVVAVLPALGLIALYARAIHESAYGFRYEYPYLLPVLGCVALLLARLWHAHPRRFVWAVTLGIAWAPAILHVTQPETMRMLQAPPGEVLRRATSEFDGDALALMGRDLGDTGLGQRAVILLGGAGQVPYYSRFRAIDWVGLNDIRLSGRYPLTIDEAWQYIEGLRPDVVYSILPPATAGVADRRDDPAFLSPSVQSSVAGRGSELIANWNRDRVATWYYREMQYIRDHFEFGAIYELPGDWALFAYVRRDSPHRDAIQRVLGQSRRSSPNLDVTALYGTDPRAHR